MKLTNLTQSPEAKSFPMEIASDLNLFEQFPQDISPQFDNLPPHNYPSPQFNYFNGGFEGGGGKRIKHQRGKSWLDILNPFECESDYDDDDYGDILDPNDLFAKRKFGKLLKLHKLKKKKKKKKIVLMKILLGILVFLAAKLLLEKYSYRMPTFFSAGRDELPMSEYHDGEHELDRGVSGITSSTSRRWKVRKNFERFKPKFYERKLD